LAKKPKLDKQVSLKTLASIANVLLGRIPLFEIQSFGVKQSLGIM